jgi:6-phosphogluconolactonase
VTGAAPEIPDPGAGADVVVLPTQELLAAAAAARLITAILDAQAVRGTASVVVTGGRVGTAVLRAVAASPARDAVDWTGVDVWWGDERWVAAGHPDRNDQQAYDALLGAVPARVHAFPAADGPYSSPEEAAEAYADELGNPTFDVLMLGVGEEGHVASIFPDSPAARSTEAVVAVHDCPKPPPTRLSLTFGAIAAADEVWLLAAGASKADAVAAALSGADPLDVPAAGARGTSRTRWLLDTEAAAKLR